MAYNPGIPQPGDIQALSQSQILNNFTSLDTIFGNDHYGFDAASFPGFHKQSTYVTQADPTTMASQIAVYSKLISAVDTLVARAPSNGTVTPIMLTSTANSVAGSAFSVQVGPIIVKGGKKPNLASGSSIVFATETGTAFPNTCITALATSNDAQYIFQNADPTTTSMTFGAWSGLKTVYWIAIGT